MGIASRSATESEASKRTKSHSGSLLKDPDSFSDFVFKDTVLLCGRPEAQSSSNSPYEFWDSRQELSDLADVDVGI